MLLCWLPFPDFGLNRDILEELRCVESSVFTINFMRAGRTSPSRLRRLSRSEERSRELAWAALPPPYPRRQCSLSLSSYFPLSAPCSP